MITVTRENGNVFFFNEKELSLLSFLKSEKRVLAYQKDQENSDFAEIENVISVTYTNDAQPVCLCFQADDPNQNGNIKDTKLVDLDIDLPFNWIRFLNVAKYHDIHTVGDLLKISLAKFSQFDNMGPKTARKVSEALTNKYGIIWK